MAKSPEKPCFGLFGFSGPEVWSQATHETPPRVFFAMIRGFQYNKNNSNNVKYVFCNIQSAFSCQVFSFPWVSKYFGHPDFSPQPPPRKRLCPRVPFPLEPRNWFTHLGHPATAGIVPTPLMISPAPTTHHSARAILLYYRSACCSCCSCSCCLLCHWPFFSTHLHLQQGGG